MSRDRYPACSIRDCRHEPRYTDIMKITEGEGGGSCARWRDVTNLHQLDCALSSVHFCSRRRQAAPFRNLVMDLGIETHARDNIIGDKYVGMNNLSEVTYRRFSNQTG
jgi:hypothetical protein